MSFVILGGKDHSLVINRSPAMSFSPTFLMS